VCGRQFLIHFPAPRQAQLIVIMTQVSHGRRVGQCGGVRPQGHLVTLLFEVLTRRAHQARRPAREVMGGVLLSQLGISAQCVGLKNDG
jgi:hypothetical protein